MNIKYVCGCMSDSLTINDVETVDMPLDNIKNVIKKLVDRETDLGVLQQILIQCVESQGEYSCTDEPCECCGDYVTTSELNI